MEIKEIILSVVTNDYNLQIDDIMQQNRLQRIAEARMVIAYCLRLLTTSSFPAIGRILGGRDHTTIMHACRKIANKIEQDSRFHGRMKMILGNIRSLEPTLQIPTNEDDVFSRTSYERPEPEETIEVTVRDVPPVNLELSPREKEFLEEYRKGMSLNQIGNDKKLSRERVRQIIKKAILKEVGTKVRDGFEMDVQEVFSNERTSHFRARNSMPEEERVKLLADYLVRANSHTSIQEFAQEVGLSTQKLAQHFPDVVKIIEQKGREKKARWSRAYIHCRGCGTTIIPHFKRGYCEQCKGVFRGERRESLLKENPICAVCSIDRKKAIQKYKKDLFITKERRVLCGGCFKQLTGILMVESRWGKIT